MPEVSQEYLDFCLESLNPEKADKMRLRADYSRFNRYAMRVFDLFNEVSTGLKNRFNKVAVIGKWAATAYAKVNCFVVNKLIGHLLENKIAHERIMEHLRLSPLIEQSLEQASRDVAQEEGGNQEGLNADIVRLGTLIHIYEGMCREAGTHGHAHIEKVLADEIELRQEELEGELEDLDMAQRIRPSFFRTGINPDDWNQEEVRKLLEESDPRHFSRDDDRQP